MSWLILSLIAGIPEGTFYLGNSEKKEKDIISRENTFSSMKFGTSEAGTPRAPADTHYQDLLTGNQNSSLSPPPYTRSPKLNQVTKVAAGSKIIRARTISAASKPRTSPRISRSGTPASRSHSPFPMAEGESPMTPVGEALYKGDYIYQQSPRGARPTQPTLVGDAHKPDNLYSPYYAQQEIPKEAPKQAQPRPSIVDEARVEQLNQVYSNKSKK